VTHLRFRFRIGKLRNHYAAGGAGAEAEVMVATLVSDVSDLAE